LVEHAVDQVVVTLGQQSQGRGLVHADHAPQIPWEQGDLDDVERVGGVGLAVAVGSQQACSGRGDVDHVLARGGELLGERAAESAGALHDEPALRPGRAPLQESPDGAGVDDEPALATRWPEASTATWA